MATPDGGAGNLRASGGDTDPRCRPETRGNTSSARNVVRLVYIESPYSRKTFPLAMERGLLESLRELMGKRDRLAAHGVLGTLEILLTKPLRPETRKRIAQLLSEMREQKAAFYAGVLRHLYHFLTE